MDEKYNLIIERLEVFREKFPNIVNLWDVFLQKRQEIFLQNLNKAEYFLNNCDNILQDDLKPETIATLYLFFNNNLNET
mgnify:FL=1|tara:strand:- start:258 stop:494 length:237 start_codon:yes stop_codon:yes gene_type:complete